MLRTPTREVRCTDCNHRMRHDSRAHRYVCETKGCHVLYAELEIRYLVPQSGDHSRYDARATERRDVLKVKRESVAAPKAS